MYIIYKPMLFEVIYLGSCFPEYKTMQDKFVDKYCVSCIGSILYFTFTILEKMQL